MDSFMYTSEELQEDDLCNTIKTQDLLQFSSSQSLGLSESEIFDNTMPPLSGEELRKMESSYNLNVVLPVLPGANVENNLFLQHPDPEHWHKYPTMEIVETKYALDMHVHPCENQNWTFNVESNKIFIKLNAAMRLTFTYKPVNDSEKLCLRAMILFASSDEMHFEVKRCANHRATSDYEGVPNEHMLRCCHPNTQYVGKETGKEFKDRLSFVVPLERPAIDDDGKATESILLEFLCMNSCATGINRKSTAVVFTLENERREIVGKKILPFKVCSCPKRDMGREDLGVAKKRGAPEPSGSVAGGKRPTMPDVKEEPTTPSPESSSGAQQFGYMPPTVAPTLSPQSFTLTMPNSDTTRCLLVCAFKEVVRVMTSSGMDEPTKTKYLECCQDIRDLLDKHCGPM